MSFIDTELSDIINNIPKVISKAKEDIFEARLTSNYRLWAAAGGIAIGKLIQVITI